MPHMSGVAIPAVRLLFGLVLALFVTYIYPKYDRVEFAPSAFRNVTPLPTPKKPSTWVTSQQGDTRFFGSVNVGIPAGFTLQDGALVIGDRVDALTSTGKALGIVPGTEFALGIWTPQDQTLFSKPFQIKFVLDEAKVPFEEVDSYVIKMFRPIDESWIEQPTSFDKSEYALVVSIEEFTPVPKDFSLGWGWRTFFGVFKKTPQESAASSLSANAAAGYQPTVNHNSNLRSGPSTTYATIGFVRAGSSVELTGQTGDGSWYQLSDGRWIAAFLVDNAPDLPVVRYGVPTNTPIPAVSPLSTPSGLVSNFESFGIWRRGDQQWGTFTQSSEQSRSGTYSGKLAYNFPASAGDQNFVVFQRDIHISGRPSVLSAWVYGDGNGNFLNAWVRDSKGQSWQFTFGQVVHTGWRQMIAPLDVTAPWPNGKIGANTGATSLTYPLTFTALALDAPIERGVNGVIYIDDVTSGNEMVILTSPDGDPPSSSPTVVAGGEETVPTSIFGRLAYGAWNAGANRSEMYIHDAATGQHIETIINGRQPDIHPDGFRIVANGTGGGRII